VIKAACTSYVVVTMVTHLITSLFRRVWEQHLVLVDNASKEMNSLMT